MNTIKHPTNFEKVNRRSVVSTLAGKVHLAPWNYCSENKEYVDSFKRISEAEKCKLPPNHLWVLIAEKISTDMH